MTTTILLLALILQPGPSSFTGPVLDAPDGDSLTILRPDGVRVKVRVWGIDAPELGQDFGRSSREAAEVLVGAGAVTIAPRGVDRYGRTLAAVRLADGRDLGVEMVRAGMAHHFRRYAPADDELARAEAEARKARAGVWSTPNPIPPWSWRKGEGVGPGVVANRRSFRYHSPTCAGAGAMAERNRLEFGSAEEAQAAGYRAAGDCPKGRGPGRRDGG